MEEKQDNIFRIKKNKNFVVMDKTFLNNHKLSWKAKGILAYMLSKPDDWTFYIDELIKHSTDGKASFRSGLKELKDNGYVKRYPVRKDNKIIKWETLVLENSLLTDFQEVGNLEVGNLEVGNRTLLNNDLTKNDITKNKERHLEFVFLKPSEYQKLTSEYSKPDIDSKIEDLDNYLGAIGKPKKYKDHNRVIRQWLKRDRIKTIEEKKKAFEQQYKSDSIET